MCPVDTKVPPQFSLSENLAIDDDRTNQEGTKITVLEILSFLIMGTIRANGDKIIPPGKRTLARSITAGIIPVPSQWLIRWLRISSGFFQIQAEMSERLVRCGGWRAMGLVQEITSVWGGLPFRRMGNK